MLQIVWNVQPTSPGRHNESTMKQKSPLGLSRAASQNILFTFSELTINIFFSYSSNVLRTFFINEFQLTIRTNAMVNFNIKEKKLKQFNHTKIVNLRSRTKYFFFTVVIASQIQCCHDNKTHGVNDFQGYFVACGMHINCAWSLLAKIFAHFIKDKLKGNFKGLCH